MVGHVGCNKNHSYYLMWCDDRYYNIRIVDVFVDVMMDVIVIVGAKEGNHNYDYVRHRDRDQVQVQVQMVGVHNREECWNLD